MDTPKWKLPPDLTTINVSVADALSQAQLFQRQRLTEDDSQYNMWLDGSISFDELQNYFSARRNSATGTLEQTSVKSSQETAQEKQQSIQDEFQYNRFQNGHSSFDDYNTYVQSRMTQEQPNTPQWESLQNNLGAATETTRVAQEDLWKSQYENGRLSYEDYSGHLNERSNMYAAGTQRNTSIQQELLKISPEYQLQQAVNKYLAMGFSTTGDTLQNLQGYQNELRNILGGYTPNSQQSLTIQQKISEVGQQVVDYKIGQDLQGLSTTLNGAYVSLTDKQNSYNNLLAMYQANPTNDNYAKVTQAYTDWQNASTLFSDTQNTYNQKKANLSNPNTFIDPTELKNILGYAPQQIEAPKSISAPPPATTPPTTPPPGATSYAGLYHIPNPSYLSNFSGSGETVKDPTTGRIYISQNTYNARHIANVADLGKYTSAQKFSIGSDWFLKPGVTKR